MLLSLNMHAAGRAGRWPVQVQPMYTPLQGPGTTYSCSKQARTRIARSWTAMLGATGSTRGEVHTAWSCPHTGLHTVASWHSQLPGPIVARQACQKGSHSTQQGHALQASPEHHKSEPHDHSSLETACPPLIDSPTCQSSPSCQPQPPSGMSELPPQPPFQLSELAQMSLAGPLPLLASLPSWAIPTLQFLSLYREVITRVAVTISMLAIIRCGLFIPLPGIDFGRFPAAEAASAGERLVKALYGQAQVLPASLFELGISPSINASIIITLVLAIPEQLVGTVGPLKRLREARKEGRTGQAYIQSQLNLLGLGFAVYLGLLKAVELQPYAVVATAWFLPLTMIGLVAGSAIIQHCANIITASGIGNGPTLVICCGIISEYSQALHTVAARLAAGTVAPALSAVLAIAYLGFAVAAVYISRTELRLPTMQYNRGSPDISQDGNAAADMGGDQDNPFVVARRVAGVRMAQRIARQEHFPLPLSNNGMMSIILAGALWYFAIPTGAELLGVKTIISALAAVQSSIAGLMVYAILVFVIEFLPLGGINPKEVAEYFNAMNVGIRGVVPGEPTEAHVQQQLLRCKFWGGLALGCLAAAAHVFDSACQAALGASLSATSLLIIVGTVIQSSRQMESLLEGPRLNNQLKREEDVIQSLRAI